MHKHKCRGPTNKLTNRYMHRDTDAHRDIHAYRNISIGIHQQCYTQRHRYTETDLPKLCRDF